MLQVGKVSSGRRISSIKKDHNKALLIQNIVLNSQLSSACQPIHDSRGLLDCGLDPTFSRVVIDRYTFRIFDILLNLYISFLCRSWVMKFLLLLVVQEECISPLFRSINAKRKQKRELTGWYSVSPSVGLKSCILPFALYKMCYSGKEKKRKILKHGESVSLLKWNGLS